MNRHLLPNEIDLLIDGEVGFGVTPLKAHVRGCPDCRAQVEQARTVVTALEHLPHLAPSYQFADRLMSRVNVFVPWHVAAVDSVKKLIPTSRPARYLAGAVAASMALVMTSVSLWLLTRLDMFMFFADLVGSRVRGYMVTAFGDLLAGTFGEPALTMLRGTGTLGIMLALAGLLTATAMVAVGMRALVGAASRRQS